MARIPDEVVERLKRDVSVERLVVAKGIELKKHGENLVGRCPFHEDRTPSLVVSPSKNLWHCLGACQVGGSVIDWVMRVEGVSFRLAVEMLKKDIPSLAASPIDGPPPKHSTTVKLDQLAEPEEADAVVLERIVGYYHTTLRESPEAQEYLKSRGIGSIEAIKHFRLGFANRTLGYRLPEGTRKTGGAIRGQLQRLGIYRESGHEHFNGAVVFPIFDARGGLAQMYGRKIRNDLRPGTPVHMYLPGPHRAVWNERALQHTKDVILCESLIDALTFWCAGMTNVIAAYGVSGFTPAHVEALKVHGTEKVLIAYDRDAAGEQAAEKLAPELASLGIEVFRILFPRNMDANEYARRVQPAAKSLETALRAAQWLAGTRPVQVPEGLDEAVAFAQGHDVPEARGEVSEPAPIPFLAAESAAAPVREDVAATVVASAPEPAAPPPSPALAIAADVKDGEVTLRFGPRTWRVRGLEKNTSLASIKVNIRVTEGSGFFSDTLDVLSARARLSFLKQAEGELEQEERVLKADLGKVILKLEELVEAQLRAKLEPEKKSHEMSESETAEAMSLLKDPKLLDRILADFEKCGVVGEESNKLVGYLAAISRKLEEPLAVVIQSSSAAGKSALMDAVLRFVPEEEQVSYSAMTGQSLFYMGGTDLQHKVLAIAEEEGATNAAYALKILQSSGELTIASTGKDPASGRLVTQEYRVTGPVMIFLTTTAIEIDEELLNRCMVLTVDEGAEQTKAIQRMQREARTLEGMKAKYERGRVMQRQQNAQRLLRPMSIVNPYALELSFASHTTRTRRDHKKYLSLIDAITLLHQHQRPVKTAQVGTATLRYIEVTREDIELANKLAGHVLGRSLDEVAPQTRRLLSLIDSLVTEIGTKQGLERSDVRFTQRELREKTGWGQTQLKVHLKTLQDLEYVLVHHHGHRQRHFYELVVSLEADGPSPFESRVYAYDTNRSGISSDRSGTGRARKRPVLSRDVEHVAQPVGETGSTHTGTRAPGVSYPRAVSGA